MVLHRCIARFLRSYVSFVDPCSSSSSSFRRLDRDGEFHQRVVFSDHLIVLHSCRCPIGFKRDEKDDTIHTSLPLFLRSSFIIVQHTCCRHHGFLHLLAR